MLFLLCMSEVVFARQLESFKENPAIKCVVEFDSSLEGAGGLLYRRINGIEICIGGFAVDLKPFEFENDSSYQNTAEYIGVILALIAMVKLGFHGVDVEIRGDSISALTWAETGRPRGELVTNASIVFTLLCVATGLTVPKATHLEAKDNWRCDALSRTLKPVND
jgi:ribonuclease HI